MNCEDGAMEIPDRIPDGMAADAIISSFEEGLRIHADNLNWAINEGNEVDLRHMAQSTAEGLLETVGLLKQWRDSLMK